MRLNENGTVRLKGIQSELVLAALVIEPLFNLYGAELVITAGTEVFNVNGERIHMVGSKHETGEALDLRSRDVAIAFREALGREVNDALGEEFDFIQEGNHFHLELDVPR